MAKSSINLTSLDFDTLKSSFKTYLKTQSVFKDYDFEGSNINVLLDVLSYNTYMNSFYLNMAVNESFLDTAQLRNSVVSHAKEINYTPASARSAKALIDISFTTTGISKTFEMPRGTQFSGTNSTGTYVFTTDKNLVSQSSSSTFTFSGVELYEGTYVSEVFVVDYNKENQRFLLSNDTVDTRSVEVQVIENNGQDITEFSRKEHLYDLTSASNIYFLQAAQDGLYEIVFGDDVFGRKPLNGATIVVNYRITRGDIGESVNSFTIDKDLGAFNGGMVTDISITTATPSSDGANAETIESIRFRSPRSLQTLDRVVTNNDYKNIILQYFPEIKDVNVYGGESVTDSVQFGKVFISVTTNSGDELTAFRKNDILKLLDNKKMISIQNVITNAEYIYVVPKIVSSVNYNNTNLSPDTISTMILNAVSSFNDTYLKSFNSTIRNSKFAEAIDNVDLSIEGSKITYQLYKKLKPDLDPNLSSTASFTGIFNNSLVPGTIYSTTFLLSDGYSYQLTDYNPNVDSFTRNTNSSRYEVVNDNPVLYLKKITTEDTETYTVIGSIDYDIGQINVNNITVVDYLENGGINVYVTPNDQDMVCKYNNVIQIDLAAVNINTVAV